MLTALTGGQIISAQSAPGDAAPARPVGLRLDVDVFVEGTSARAGLSPDDLRAAVGFTAAVGELLAGAAAVPHPPVWASITYRPKPAAATTTLAATHIAAAHTDEAQYSALQGPCLDALLGPPGTPVVCNDLTVDGRWPKLVTEINKRASPPRAALSSPLPLPNGERACLNLYAPVVGRWSGTEESDLARLIAHLVAAQLANLLAHRRVAHLQHALDSNRLIAAAVGILMHQQRETYEQAHSRLVAVSHSSHRKVRDLAEEVVFTGTLLR